MRLETHENDDGFDLILVDGGDRSRFIKWSASDGARRDDGRVDLSMVGRRQAVPIHLGWKPSSINLEPIRDSTPGMTQSYVSYLPQGVAVLSFVAENGVSGVYQVFASASGRPYDVRSMGSLPTCKPGAQVTVKIVMTSPWVRVFIKKMVDGQPRMILSDFKVTVATGDVYQAMSHLIKPEGLGVSKSGKNGVVFEENAPKWCYANLAFQRF